MEMILNCASQAAEDACGFNHPTKNFSKRLIHKILLVLAQGSVSHPELALIGRRVTHQREALPSPKVCKKFKKLLRIYCLLTFPTNHSILVIKNKPSIHFYCMLLKLFISRNCPIHKGIWLMDQLSTKQKEKRERKKKEEKMGHSFVLQTFSK